MISRAAHNRTKSLAAFAAALGLCVGAPALAQSKSRKMTAEAVKERGFESLKTFTDADVDGDGRKDVVVVGKGPKGIQLLLVGENEAGAVVTQIVDPAGGKEFGKLEKMSLAPPANSDELVLEVYDETPDEKLKRVRVYAGRDKKLKEVFSSVMQRSKSVDERPEYERDKSMVLYGDARPGWYFEDLEDDGVTEILVRRKPQILSVPAKKADTVKLLTGVRELVYRWNDAAFQFDPQSGERLNEFLPAVELTGATASSAFVPAAELKELRGQALNAALQAEGDAAAADTDKANKVKAKADDEVDFDLTAYVVRAIDKDLATGWIEGNPKNDGKGDWLEVQLAEDTEVHMVRLVLGCVDTKKSFGQYNVPQAFTVQLGDGAAARVDRKQAGVFDAPAVAFLELPLKDRPWAKQLLVFFDGKRSTEKVRITLDKAQRQGVLNQTCISEVSVH